ncbi:NfeD family protein [Burkholderia ubonensis]|uniref:NfeD family protein n=1 Tax=Burkholderia ubonensis TaxID=101571 RepID=UPI000752094B|nr:nodulation protein NfeD [Burkholderia ubonensis]AOI73947.1 serine protease [Burkholderia ubonensis]KUZ16133.1 serine protease [Burkholderia ubonensis]KUZ26467.1 serine protease [Burkholderia ubonensis]KUZ29826.1 serine protease [Burkholderia ubonensis]KUZ44529.1 serine protease [Burkholderia ubonensis]
MRFQRHWHLPTPDASGRHSHHPLSARVARAALFAALLVVCAVAAAPRAANAPPPAAHPPIIVIPVNGAIGPASADFIVRSLGRAAKERAPLAILQLDTPGGLDSSMRVIIKAILGSPVPVAAFVGPSGARAASAGTYIVYASHVAAMAPGTNLGAASPVQFGIGGAPGGAPPSPTGGPASPASGASGASGTLPSDTQSTEARKVMHDSAAYIRGLAQLRGRNADWAERAVREAVSLSASEAHTQHVVDVVAQDPADLARQLDGRTVTTSAGAQHLATAHAPLVVVEPDWRSRFLSIITDPNVALILLTFGIYGLFFEFANPGFVLPGLVGTICLLIGLFAMQLLPVNYAGLGLVLLGLACLVAEAFLPTFGVLGFGGIASFTIGALMLIDTDVPGYGIPWPLIASLGFTGGLLVAGVSSLALRARRRPVVTGAEAMVGSIGEVLDDGLVPDQPQTAGGPEPSAAGWALVRGERWRVACSAPLAAGCRVRVTARQGLMLTVAPLYDKPPTSVVKGEQQ